jgi:N-acetylglucosamine-6-phosphate deacetylase
VTSISAPRVLLDGRLADRATVVFDASGAITEVLEGDVPGGSAGGRARPADGPADDSTGGDAPADDHIRLESGILAPGLVDIQTNGSFGVDFITASDEEWHLVSRRLPETGVTSFQPTYITAPLATLLEGLRRAGAIVGTLEGSRALGVHLEGPFLSPAKRGVHEAKYIVEPTPERVGTVLETLHAEGTTGLVTMVTLAPETAGGQEAVRRFTDAGIRVSLGHTDAFAADVLEAADNGATLITHLFNAQRPLGHREPGVPGAALYDARFTSGLIADLHHVAPEICALVWRVAGGRVALVTDAIAAAGMPPGEYELSGIPVTLGDDGVPRDADGIIAGSALTLDRAVRNLIGIGLDAATVLEAASRIPADALGRPDLGRIAPGAAADLVWFDDDFNPLRTWVSGRSVFEAGDGSTAAANAVAALIGRPTETAREHLSASA